MESYITTDGRTRTKDQVKSNLKDCKRQVEHMKASENESALQHWEKQVKVAELEVAKFEE